MKHLCESRSNEPQQVEPWGLREKKTGQGHPAVQRNCLSHVRSNGHVFPIGDPRGHLYGYPSG